MSELYSLILSNHPGVIRITTDHIRSNFYVHNLTRFQYVSDDDTSDSNDDDSSNDDTSDSSKDDTSDSSKDDTSDTRNDDTSDSSNDDTSDSNDDISDNNDDTSDSSNDDTSDSSNDDDISNDDTSDSNDDSSDPNVEFFTEELTIALIQNTTIQTYDFHRIDINDAGLANSIGRILESNKTIVNLDLESSTIIFSARFFAALSTNTTLRYLHLGMTGLNLDTILNLASALRMNTGLAKLFLGGNSIGDTGMTPLILALAESNCLNQLDLSRTDITDKSLLPLAEWLKRPDCSLHSLNLNGIMVTEGSQELHKFIFTLRHNRSLIRLDFDTKMQEEDCYQFQSALRVNSTLEQINLPYWVPAEMWLKILDYNSSLICIRSADMIVRDKLKRNQENQHRRAVLLSQLLLEHV